MEGNQFESAARPQSWMICSREGVPFTEQRYRIRTAAERQRRWLIQSEDLNPDRLFVAASCDRPNMD